MTERSTNEGELGRLAKEQGWTDEQLRKCYDCEKITLPPNTPLIEYPREFMEDVDLGKPPTDAKVEFEKLAKSFSDLISHVVVKKEKTKDESPHLPTGSPSGSRRGSKRTPHGRK